MEFIRGIHNVKQCHQGCVLSIGNFDGFHVGHQKLIYTLRQIGKMMSSPVMVMIFEPQPQEYFTQNKLRLTRLRDKVKYLFSAGVDLILCVSFDENFAKLQASNFIDDLLINKLGISCICIGSDFKFGANRQGDMLLLKRAGKRFGFKVVNIVTCIKKGQRVSSSNIRNALIQDRLRDAESFLGHAYCLSGRVIHGNSLGRTLGFPTANISFKGSKLPINGVYIVEVNGISNGSLPGLANIGVRPTFGGYNQQLEVHIFDVMKNLYGSYIEVIIRSKVRNEKQFLSLESLKYQINNDIIYARNYFKMI